MIRPFHHSQFPAELLRERKREPVTVVLPTREVADTIGPIVERLHVARRALVDQVLVVDAASEDGTAEIAASLGAEVHQEAELLPEFGQVLGKGDAMWRALAVARRRADRLPRLGHARLLAPLRDRAAGPADLPSRRRPFVKGHFRRPFTGEAGAATRSTAGA